MSYVKHLESIAVAAAIAFGSAPALANEIAFENDHTSAWQLIAFDYGSIVGQLDTLLQTNAGNQLSFWPDSYSFRPIAFSTNDSIGHITLTPINGYTISLDSFFLGAWPNLDRTISYKVDDLGTPGLDIDVDDAFISGTTGLTVSAAMTSASGIKITFGPEGYNGGINNIRYTLQAPVPEPETWAMLLAGVFGIGLRLARRRG